MRVEAAPVLRLAGVGLVIPLGKIEELVVAVGLIRLRAAPADLPIQQATHPESVVANHLGIQPPAALSCEKSIVRIAQSQIGRINGSLSVRAGQHHQLDHVFDIPSAVDELDGQPVEQFGMVRRFALCSEIFEAARQTSPVEQLPQPVDEDARGERVVARGQPVREVQPSRSAPRHELFENHRHARFDDLTAVIHPVTASQHANRTR